MITNYIIIIYIGVMAHREFTVVLVCLRSLESLHGVAIMIVIPVSVRDAVWSSEYMRTRIQQLQE